MKKITITILILILGIFISLEVYAKGVEVRSFFSFSSNFFEDEQGNLKYTVQAGDTLWSIAQSAYGKGLEDFWPFIFNANNISLLHNGYPLITPRQILTIPDIPTSSLIEKDFLSVISLSEFDSPEPILIPNLALENMIENGDFPNESKNLGVRLSGSSTIGPYSPSEGVRAPMDSFIRNTNKTGFSYNPNRCGGYPSILSDMQISDYHISECVSSGAVKSRAYKIKDETRQGTNEGFLVVKDDEFIGSYSFADQLVYHPIADEFAFRANRGNDWFVVVNGQEKSYNYVETIFYITDGTFYIVAQDGSDWVVERDNKEIERAAFIDNFMYIDNGSNVAYRIHKIDGLADEWFYVVRGVKQQSWDYVDKLTYNKDTNGIFYRFRNSNGNWFFAKVNSSNESIIIYEGLKEVGELSELLLNPIREDYFIGAYELNGKEILIKNIDDTVREYELVGIPSFSDDGNHFSYIAYQQISSSNSVNDLIIDNTYVKKICISSFCSLDLPEFVEFFFGKGSDTLIIYTYEDGSFTRTEYFLDANLINI